MEPAGLERMARWAPVHVLSCGTLVGGERIKSRLLTLEAPGLGSRGPQHLGPAPVPCLEWAHGPDGIPGSPSHSPLLRT